MVVPRVPRFDFRRILEGHDRQNRNTRERNNTHTVYSTTSTPTEQFICETKTTSFARYVILSRVNTVLYFQASGKVSARQKLEGVYVYGREHGWDVQVIEPGVAEHKTEDLVRFWEPDGIIVECGSGQNHFDPAIFGKTSTAFLDRNPKTLKKSAPCVTHDSVATAKVAAFLERGTGSGIRRGAPPCREPSAFSPQMTSCRHRSPPQRRAQD